MSKWVVFYFDQTKQLTDASGHFQFRSIRAGSYYLRVEPTGLPFEDYSQQIELYSMTRRNSATEDATLVDVVLKQKRLRDRSGSTSSRVVFAQVVPQQARNEYDRGTAYHWMW